MFQLKPLSKQGIPRALAKAERYRLLNEPQDSESICADILRADPESQEALVMLLLALTDQFPAVGLERAREVLPRLKTEYDRAYYAGIIDERWGKAQLEGGHDASIGHGWLREALNWYEKAEALKAPGNEDAVLRHNACVRVLGVVEDPEGEQETGLDG